MNGVVVRNDVFDEAGVIVLGAEYDIEAHRIVIDVVFGSAVEVALVVVHLELGIHIRAIPGDFCVLVGQPIAGRIFGEPVFTDGGILTVEAWHVERKCHEVVAEAVCSECDLHRSRKEGSLHLL